MQIGHCLFLMFFIPSSLVQAHFFVLFLLVSSAVLRGLVLDDKYLVPLNDKTNVALGMMEQAGILVASGEADYADDL